MHSIAWDQTFSAKNPKTQYTGLIWVLGLRLEQNMILWYLEYEHLNENDPRPHRDKHNNRVLCYKWYIPWSRDHDNSAAMTENLYMAWWR